MKSIIFILVLIVAMIILRVTVFNQSIAQIAPCLKVSCAYNRHFIEDFLFVLPLALLLCWNADLLVATKNPLCSEIFSAGKVTYLSAFLIFIFGFFYDTLTHDKIVLATFLAYLIVCLAQYGAIYYLLIKTKKLSINGVMRQHVQKQVRLSYLKSGISFMFNNIIYAAMGVISMLMIEWLSPNEAVLGYYIIIMKITSITAVMASSIYFIMQPYLSDLKNSSRLSDLQKILNLNVILNVVWLIICIAIFLIFKKIIFKLYNINFNYASFAVILNFIAGAIFNVTGISEQICLYNDMNKRLYSISIIQLIMIGLLSYILIPHFSYLGAIISFNITEVFCGLVCWFMVRCHGIKVKLFGFI